MYMFYLICVNIIHNFNQTNGSTLSLFLLSFAHHSFSLLFPSFFPFLILSFLTVFMFVSFFPLFHYLFFCSRVLSSSSCFLLSYNLLFATLNFILSIHFFPFLCAFLISLLVIYLFSSPCFIISLSLIFFFFQTICLNPAILYKLVSDI